MLIQFKIKRESCDQSYLTEKLYDELKTTKDVKLIPDSVGNNISSLMSPELIMHKLMETEWQTDRSYDGIQGYAMILGGPVENVVFATNYPNGDRTVNINHCNYLTSEESEHMAIDGDASRYVDLVRNHEVKIDKVYVAEGLEPQNDYNIDPGTLEIGNDDALSKKFRHLDQLIPVANIVNYHTILLEEYGKEELSKEVNGVTYQLTNEKGYGTLSWSGGNVRREDMLTFDKWLISKFDPDHKLLAKSLELDYSDYLEAVDLDIYDHVNNLVALRNWNELNHEPKTNIMDFSSCSVYPVLTAFATLNSINLAKLKSRLQRTDDRMTLYRYPDGATIDCALSKDGDISLECSRTGMSIIPAEEAYGGGDQKETLVGVRCTRESVLSPIQSQSVYQANTMLTIFASINNLSCKTYLKHWE